MHWEDLTLDGPKLAVRLAGIFTKNGDDALVPLQAFLAEAMKDMRKRRSVVQIADGKGPVQQTDKVFHVPDMVARLVRKDAAITGLIPQVSLTSKRSKAAANRGLNGATNQGRGMPASRNPGLGIEGPASWPPPAPGRFGVSLLAWICCIRWART